MNVASIKNCYGCGVCSKACPKNIITIGLNSNGFYEPIVDVEKCVDCNLCIDVCAFNHSTLAVENEPLVSYAAWSDDKRVQRKCSSGGIGFEIAKQLIEQEHKVCGVKYNADEKRAEHYIATTVEECIQSIGSKYIQSYTTDGFRAINRKDKYLITGTPCQIDSFRRYIKRFKVESNFVLLDFFCHSVPSMLAWEKYIQLVEKKVGEITYASWRNKHTGWHDSWAMGIDGKENGDKVDWHDSYNVLIKEKKNYYTSRLSKGDIFYRLFLEDYCCNPACVKDCKYKYKKSAADIRIGDLWGNTYKNNEDGVSALVVYTDKGREVIENLHNCALVEHPFEVVAEGQMKKNAGKAYLAPLVGAILKSNINSEQLWKIIFRIEFVLRLPKRVVNKIIRVIYGK